MTAIKVIAGIFAGLVIFLGLYHSQGFIVIILVAPFVYWITFGLLSLLLYLAHKPNKKSGQVEPAAKDNP